MRNFSYKKSVLLGLLLASALGVSGCGIGGKSSESSPEILAQASSGGSNSSSGGSTDGGNLSSSGGEASSSSSSGGELPAGSSSSSSSSSGGDLSSSSSSSSGGVLPAAPDRLAWWASQSGTSDPVPTSWVLNVNFDNSPIGQYTAADFSRDWNKSPQSSDGLAAGRLNIVQDPKDSGRHAMRVTYLAGQVGGNSAMTFDAPLPSGHTSLWFQYKVLFDENFTWKKGGKLPGLGAGSTPTGCIDNGTFDGFTTRLMWREKGAAYGYLYYPNKVERCGDYAALNTQFEPNKWYTITQHVTLNDVGQSNGSMEQYIDGVKVMSMSNWAWRVNSAVSINAIKMDTFFGGSDASTWAPATDQYAYFADFTVSATSPLGTVTSYKERLPQVNPQEGYAQWRAASTYAIGDKVYVIDAQGRYHYYHARAAVAANLSPETNRVIDIYDGVTGLPIPSSLVGTAGLINGPGPTVVDLGSSAQPWVEQTVAPWYGDGHLAGASWTPESLADAASKFVTGVTDPGDGGDLMGNVVWNIYNPTANALLPTSSNSILAGYGSATRFYEKSAGDANLFSISAGAANFVTSASSGVRLCWGSSCNNTHNSIVQDTYPKTFTWLACVKTNDAAKAALDIELGLGGASAAGAKIKAVIQKKSTSAGNLTTGLQLSTGTTLTSVVDTTAYHLYHVTVTLTDPGPNPLLFPGTVNAFIDGVQAVPTSSALPFTGSFQASSSPFNYMLVGSNSGSSAAYNGSLAWLIWTQNQAHTTPAQMAGRLPAGLGSQCSTGLAHY